MNNDNWGGLSTLENQQVAKIVWQKKVPVSRCRARLSLAWYKITQILQEKYSDYNFYMKIKMSTNYPEI